MAEINKEQEVGFIGLGKMGGTLATRLVKGGCTLCVYDINPAAVDRLVRLGARAAASPKAVADDARIVFASLPTVQASLDVALGKDGIIHGKRRAIYIETSTSGRSTIKSIESGLKAAGVAMLDATISGGVIGAEEGRLSVMLAGADDVIAEARPYLETFGKKFFKISDQPGMAQFAKLLNNTVGAAGMAAAFECMVLGVKAGLDPQVLIDVINAGTGRNSTTEEKIPRAVLTRTFNLGGQIGNRIREYKLVLEEAEQLGVPMWTSAAVAQLFNFAATQASPSEDTTTLIKHMEKWAGVEVGRKQS